MKPGGRITFTLLPDATVLVPLKSKSVTAFAGALHRKGSKPVSVEQLSHR